MKKQIFILSLLAVVSGSIATGCSFSKSGSANDTTMNYKVNGGVASPTIKRDTMKNDTFHH